MKKHSLFFATIVVVTLVTIACNIPFVSPATPQDPQAGQPPQQPEQPRQPMPQPGQPEQQPIQPGQQPGGQPGGPGPVPSGPLQIDQTVNVPGGGGSAEIAFDISDGEWIHIVLTAGNANMQPYGSLQYPNGISVDSPPLNTTANGMNEGDILLTDSGHYSLTLFDGSNQGGTVSVKIVGSQ